MNTRKLDWKKFNAYQVFDEFLERFVLSEKSYVTKHEHKLDLQAAYQDILVRYVDGYDKSKKDFEDKILHQFLTANEETKVVFCNVEYLWSMSVANIRPERKRSYVKRWFPNDRDVVSGDRYFFWDEHAIADPGQWYLLNKYNELRAILRILNLLNEDAHVIDLDTAKQRITNLCYSAIYDGIDEGEKFSVSVSCGVHAALLHLSNPDQFEPIISENHKTRITEVFRHVIEDRSDISCREEQIRLIRERLSARYGHGEDSDRKRRWFFYLDSIKPLWFGKKRKFEQSNASINDQIHLEQETIDLIEEEGGQIPVVGVRLYRSSKLVLEVKKRDGYTCRACDFSFKQQIVHVHHLDPLSERGSPSATEPEDLVTLCPNCHYLAHYWLRQKNGDEYKQLDFLLKKLKDTNKKRLAG